MYCLHSFFSVCMILIYVFIILLQLFSWASAKSPSKPHRILINSFALIIWAFCKLQSSCIGFHQTVIQVNSALLSISTHNHYPNLNPNPRHTEELNVHFSLSHHEDKTQECHEHQECPSYSFFTTHLFAHLHCCSSYRNFFVLETILCFVLRSFLV